MFGFRSIYKFTRLSSLGLSARKYMRSVSQSALRFKPQKLRQLSQQQSIKDRVVQQFFDSSSLVHRIKVFQSQNRLKQITEFSTPSHSFYQVLLPFQDNLNLRNRMVQFFQKYVRVGRVLQLMDYIAANVAYRYCYPNQLNLTDIKQLPFMVVTAAIDQIDFFHPILAEVNCSFSGYVSYVGKSSMEVQICVVQEVDGKQRLACSAKFVMAARDKTTNKSYKVPSLDLSKQSQSFKIKNQLGQIRQKQRKVEAQKELRISPPTYQQSSIVHNLLIKVESQIEKEKNQNKKWIQMSDTVQRTTMLMHLQDKNLSGKIFGGFIMRLAYQLGWLTGYRFLKGRYPKCTHIDDVQFFAPVQVGSVVELESKISFINEQIMHVIVQCRNSKPTGETHLTNLLRINFDHNTPEIRKVYPVTMRQTSQYIESMRRVKKYLQE